MNEHFFCVSTNDVQEPAKPATSVVESKVEKTEPAPVAASSTAASDSSDDDITDLLNSLGDINE